MMNFLLYKKIINYVKKCCTHKIEMVKKVGRLNISKLYRKRNI